MQWTRQQFDRIGFIDAWDKLDKDMIRKSFRVCGLSVKTEGSKDDLRITPIIKQGKLMLSIVILFLSSDFACRI